MPYAVAQMALCPAEPREEGVPLRCRERRRIRFAAPVSQLLSDGSPSRGDGAAHEIEQTEKDLQVAIGLTLAREASVSAG